MKKVIGILGVAVFALAMFMNTNAINSSPDVNLANLLGVSEANAEFGGGTPCSNGSSGQCSFMDRTCWIASWDQDCDYYAGGF